LTIVSLVPGMILRAEQRRTPAKHQSKQQACAWKFKSPQQILA